MAVIKTFGSYSQGTRRGKATVRITRSGTFSLSSGLVEKIGLNTNQDRLLIRQYKTKPEHTQVFNEPEIEWVLSVVPFESDFYEDAIDIRVSKGKKGARFYCKEAAITLLDDLAVEEEGITLQVATTSYEKKSSEQETAYAIITAPILAELKNKNIRSTGERFVVDQRVAEVVSDKEDA